MNGGKEVKQFCIYSSDSNNSVVVVVVIDTVGPVITIVITPKNKLAAVKTITKKKIFCVVAVRA